MPLPALSAELFRYVAFPLDLDQLFATENIFIILSLTDGDRFPCTANEPYVSIKKSFSPSRAYERARLCTIVSGNWDVIRSLGTRRTSSRHVGPDRDL